MCDGKSKGFDTQSVDGGSEEMSTKCFPVRKWFGGSCAKVLGQVINPLVLCKTHSNTRL